jgi:peptidoglycan/xylan/chitin deacetylase (PgdA/CDA1 family)
MKTSLRAACTSLLVMVAMRTLAADIAVTFDDLPVVRSNAPIAQQEAWTRDLLAALRARDIRAVGFVNAGKLIADGKVQPRRRALLTQWLDAGLELGNHTFDHRDLHHIGVDAFLQEIDRGDAPLRELLATRKSKPRYFRHPFLHSGRSVADHERIERFLASRGYQVAPVTIDNAD